MNPPTSTVSLTVPPAPPTPAPPTGAFATQPLITVTSITTAVSAAVLVAVNFGLDIDANTETAINTLVLALWPIVTTAWAWYKVYAPATVQKAINDAAVAGRFGDTPPRVDPPKIV
jgi:hypothetical protein